MNQDEIIEMARRARLHRNQHNLASNPVQYKFSYDGTEEALIAFAKLVADVATAKEREACAKVSEEKGLSWKTRRDINPDNAEKAYMASQFIADAIRARGEA